MKGDVDAKKRIIKQNFLKAVIFYDDLSHETINEVPQYTVNMLWNCCACYSLDTEIKHDGRTILI